MAKTFWKTLIVTIPFSVIANSWDSLKQFFWLPIFIRWYSERYQLGLWLLVLAQMLSQFIRAIILKEVQIQQNLLEIKVSLISDFLR